MPNAHDVLFRTLADPTRRAIFERLCREGEQTVGALTARAGVSQPAVSKHLGVLKQAGLVRDRHEGRQTHYSAQLGALGPADRLDKPDGRLLAKPVRPPRRSAQKDGPMSKPATETLSVVAKERRPVKKSERLEGRKRRRLSLSADRCENQGAERLAGRDARSGPNSHQAGRPRSGRGVEVERGSGVVARRNHLHR